MRVLSGQLGGIVLRGGHDLIQKADLAVLAVIHIVDANLVAAARQVDPAGGGKQAGKVFHAGAAVIIGTFLRVGNDQVRRNINHAACAEIPHKTQRQHHKFHQNQQQDQPVLAAENFFELLQTSTLPSQHDLKYYLTYYRGLYDGAQENLHQTGKKTLAFGNKSDV